MYYILAFLAGLITLKLYQFYKQPVTREKFVIKLKNGVVTSIDCTVVPEIRNDLWAS